MTSRDQGRVERASQDAGQKDTGTRTGWTPERLERAWWIVFGVLVIVFSAFPIANYLLGYATKDYGLWYQVGLAIRRGFDIYPRPETRRLFPFMYPPSAAAMLAVVSYLGSLGSLLALVAINSAAWLVSILLAQKLVLKPGERPHVLLYLLPSLSVIVLVHNIYLLGQPNLLLLALVLGSLLCLRAERPYSAGALVATAAAIKAFPIMVIGYFIYRRKWAASASTVAVLAAWLFLAPLPFRTPAQTVDDLTVWSQGMLFTYNTHGIAQRPYRSYSYKNQSIMALAHRLLRDVPADGETVLAARARTTTAVVDPSNDLMSFLKRHPGAVNPKKPQPKDLTDTRLTGAAGSATRWDDNLENAGTDMKKAWRVNVADLNFRAVTLATLLAIGLICGFVLWCLPAQSQSTGAALPLEYAIVILLTTMFSPLSFNYAYVWLLYPTTLGLAIAFDTSVDRRLFKLRRAWIGAVLLIPASAIVMPKLAQAYGNLFLPALILLIGFGLELRRLGRQGTRVTPESGEPRSMQTQQAPHVLGNRARAATSIEA